METAAKKSCAFDAAILDLVMPEMNGEEVSRQIRASKSLRGIKIVVITSAGIERRSTVLEAGADLFLHKPVRRLDLYGHLVEVLSGTRPRAVIESRDPGSFVHILLAEDNPVNQKVAEMMLLKLGYAVDVVANGALALKALDEKDYTLILMDCQMPVLDGYEATRAIRNRRDPKKDIPIIAVTANVVVNARERALESGMNDFITKPVRISDLKQAVTRALDAISKDEVIDPSILRDLRSLQQEGEPDILTELIDAFDKDVHKHITLMKKFVEESNLELLKDTAHALKGSSCALGVMRMAEICDDLKTIVNTGKKDTLSKEIARLESAYVDVKPALAAKRKS